MHEVQNVKKTFDHSKFFVSRREYTTAFLHPCAKAKCCNMFKNAKNTYDWAFPCFTLL